MFQDFILCYSFSEPLSAQPLPLANVEWIMFWLSNNRVHSEADSGHMVSPIT